jgi:hypothetical protein
MSKYILNILISTIFIMLTACTGQVNTKQTTKEIITDSLGSKSSHIDLGKIYNQAISDFITEVYKKDLIHFDTLFFGKRNNGQPDDFPDIAIAKTIKNIKIRLVDPAIGKKLQEEKRSRVYINLIGWVDNENAEFIFVTFSNGFEHKFDCHINYKYNSKLKVFDLIGSRIEIPIKN